MARDIEPVGIKDDAEIEQNELHSQTTASSGVADDRLTLWQNVKKYRRIVGYTFALTSAILLYGYDNVVVGTVSGMPGFQHDFGRKHDGKWILPASWLALWNLAGPIGAMLGSLFGGWFQDRVGRRPALGICSFVSAGAVAVMYVSYLPEDINGRRGCFFAGKFLQGLSVGAVMAATQTYMSEILPPVLRGSGMAFFPVFTLLGQLTGALVIFGNLGDSKGYKLAFASQWPFSAVPVIVACFIPESPAYYVRKNQMEKALSAQKRLDPPGVDSFAIVEKVRLDIEKEKQSSKSTYLECFYKKNFRRTFIVIWANCITSFFGLALLGKASYFLEVVGLSSNAAVLFLILGIVLGLIANLVSVWAISRVGRRPLIHYTLGLSSIVYLTMGIANCFHSMAVAWWTAVCLMLVIIICGVGAWPASYAVGAETSSLQLRAKTQGIGWFVSAASSLVSGVVLPYVFNPDAGNLKGKVGFTYFAACLLGLLGTYFIVPEMKGRTIGEIDHMFELKLPVRDFKSWRTGDDDSSERPVRSGGSEPWV